MNFCSVVKKIVVKKIVVKKMMVIKIIAKKIATRNNSLCGIVLKSALLTSLLWSSLTVAHSATPVSLKKAEQHTTTETNINYKEVIKTEAMKNYKGQMVLVIGQDGARILALVRTPAKSGS